MDAKYECINQMCRKVIKIPKDELAREPYYCPKCKVIMKRSVK